MIKLKSAEEFLSNVEVKLAASSLYFQCCENRKKLSLEDVRSKEKLHRETVFSRILQNGGRYLNCGQRRKATGRAACVVRLLLKQELKGKTGK